MFKYDTHLAQDTVQVILDGKIVSLPTGINVAAALLGIGETTFRISPSSHQPCSPYCLMGACFECVMEIDGVKRQACLTPVRDGMVINRHLDDEKESVS
jgi:NADH dehydrogenase/NADH:ubiquinone oxidoreductase subunit G